MAINLYATPAGDGLFNIQGKAFKALNALNTARLTTIPAAVEAYLTQYELWAESDDLDFVQAMEGLPTATAAWQSTGNSLCSSVGRTVERMLIEAVQADDDRPVKSLIDSLEYVIAQMEADGDYVDPSAVTFTLTAAAGNVGDVVIAYTAKRGDGLVQANAYGEDVLVDVTSGGASPTVRFRGEIAESNRYSQAWPAGSGSSVSVSATVGSASLLVNGDFEDETIANSPDEWIVGVGTPGTTLIGTDTCVQTVTISGTPTGGSYLLEWTDKQGVTRATDTLAYNATAATVQAALREIPGLEEVTVTAAGTSPNYTHTVTFAGDGVHGSVSQLTSVSHLTGGTPSIAHATTTVGNAGAYRGKALEIVGDGAQLTTLYHALTLSAETVYFCHLRAIRGPVRDGSSSSSAGAVTGTLVVDVVQEIGGDALTDPAGNAQTLTIPLDGLSDVEHESKWFSFRLALSVTYPVYLRVRLTEAISAGDSIFLDDIAVVAGTRLYAGGPYVATFAGRVPPVGHSNGKADGADSWTLAVANDRGGAVQEWYNRVFDMASKDLLLPTTGDGTNIPDSVLA